MKRTFCDRCGVECNGQSVQRFTIFDVNKAIDVCESCYTEFFRWLNDSNKPPHEETDFNEWVKNSVHVVCNTDQKKVMDEITDKYFKKINNDIHDLDDGVDEFIKDVVKGDENNEN